jgi:peptide-methionine (S)-S-oxide reductase
VRTRVGYAGGTTPDPTYRSIGDHTETFQVDFDPDLVSFAELLDLFWTEHSPTSRPWSTQYAHIAFFSDEAQRDAIEASRARLEAGLGPAGRVTTQVRPLERFHMAEDYHQKYYLRNSGAPASEFEAMYPSPDGLRDSTAAARVNGWLGGGGPSQGLLAEIDGYGLSEGAKTKLLRSAGSRPQDAAGCALPGASG